MAQSYVVSINNFRLFDSPALSSNTAYREHRGVGLISVDVNEYRVNWIRWLGANLKMIASALVCNKETSCSSGCTLLKDV